MSYDIFSRYYDSLMQNADYDARAEYCRKIFTDNGIDGGILLDLGCGTGSVSIRMADYGYEVIGVDISAGMLTQAVQKAFGKDILFLNQSMEELDLYGTVDSCICVMDCINHLSSAENVKAAFSKVSMFMNPDGIFVFDVNTVYKHRFVLGDNSFILESEKLFCAWQNSLGDDDSVDVSLDFFEEENGAYYRESEDFTERAYPLKDIEAMLNEADFEVLNIYDDLSFSPVREDSERAVFVARRINNG